MTDYSELQCLAESATPGEWQAYDTHGKRFIESMIGEAHVVCDTPKKQWLKDSAYIAAASPPVVLAMIAEIKRLRADLDGEISSARDFNIEHEEIKHECEQARAEGEALRKDAERYRWIRDSAPKLLIEAPLIVMCSPDGSVMFRDPGCEMLLSGAQADQAIDAAMSKEPSNG